jgi:hypothetical protein
MYIFFIRTSLALVSTMQTIEISSGTSTSIILLTSPTFWVRDSSNTFIYNCAAWNVYAAKMRHLELYNALNTLREIGRGPSASIKNQRHMLILWSMYHLIVFLISKILHTIHFSTPAHVKTVRPHCKENLI